MSEFRMTSFTPQVIQSSKKFDPPRKEKSETGETLEDLFPLEVKLEATPGPQRAVKAKPAREPAPDSVHKEVETDPKAPESPEAAKNTESPDAREEASQEVPEAVVPPQLTESEPQVSPPANEISPTQWEDLFAEAVKLFKEGKDGSKKAAREAYDLLDRIKEMVPENNLVEAYYGSATALLARDAKDVADKMAKAMKGLKILDRSVSRDPENTEIRTLRAYLCLRLPELYFKRTATAVEDFSYLASRYESNGEVFSHQIYYQVLYDLGKAFKNLGNKPNADAVWKKLLSVCDDPKYSDLLIQEGLTSSPPEDPVTTTAPQHNSLTGQKKTEIIEEGSILHAAALRGGAEKSEKAFEFFSKALEAYPDDSLINAYYADCLSMKGRDALEPGNMFENVYKSLNILDSAAESDPENIQVRMIKAYHSFRLPEFFRRTEAAIVEFENIMGRCEQDETVLPPKAYWQIIYDCGAAYKRLGFERKAQEAWEKLLSLNPDPEFQALVSQQQPGGPAEAATAPASPDSKEKALQEGIRLLILGLDGNREAVKLAHDLLKKAHEMNTEDLLVLAYYGSSISLLGRDAADPKNMFENVFKGLKLINNAFYRDMKNLRIRLLRAYVTCSLPGFFKQTQTAIQDLRFIKEAYEENSSVIPQEVYWQVLYYLGVALRRAGNNLDAKKVWSKLVAESTDPKYQELVNLEP